MRRQARTILPAVALLSLALVTGAATPPDSVVEFDPSTERLMPGAQVQVATGTLRLTFADDAPAPTLVDLNQVLNALRWRGGGDAGMLMTLSVQRYNPAEGGALLTYWIAAPDTERPAQDVVARGQEAFVSAIKRILAGDEPLRAEIRKAKFRELEIHLGRVRAMREVLKTMSQSQPSRSDELAERVKSLYAQREQLEMARVAREARDAALRQAITEQRREAEDRLRADGVAAEIRAIVKLRDEEARRLEKMRDAGLDPGGQLAEAQAKLIEARVKLAEREAAAARAGQGEVLERLSAELAMVKVDLTDVEIQLAHVRDRLQRLDPRKATTQSLGQVLDDGTVPVGATALPPLYQDLIREERELVRRKLALQVESVEESK